MIEKLRRKFIVISMGSIFAVLAVIVLFINLSGYFQINRQADRMMQLITENNGHFPKVQKFEEEPFDAERKPKFSDVSPEAPFSTRFFTVTADAERNVVTVDTGKIAATTTTEATAYAREILKSGKTTGFKGIYKYAVVNKENGSLIVFLDCRRDLETFTAFLRNSILISIAALISVFIMVMLLSKKAIKPVAESYEKQKRFITDAGHELKTPIAIISANTEVIEMDYGENQWTRSISNQTKRMTELTSSLVTLARMDEGTSGLQMTDFSLSDAVLESAEPFIVFAKAQEKNMTINIEPTVSYHGNEQSIRQLVSILLDNAVKYSSAGGEIELSLKKQGKHINLFACNLADNLQEGNLDILFERFYRTDVSRNSKAGGYGIGLAIAKAIVVQHKGKIKAESSDGKFIHITIQL